MAQRRHTTWERGDGSTAELFWHGGGPFDDSPVHRSTGVWLRRPDGVQYWLARSWSGAYDRACEYGYLPTTPVTDNADGWLNDWLNPDPRPLQEPELEDL